MRFRRRVCITQNRLREVSALLTEICMAQPHFWTLGWTALIVFLDLDLRSGVQNPPLPLGEGNAPMSESFAPIVFPVSVLPAEICRARRHPWTLH